MPRKVDPSGWLGKLRGHVSESKARFEQDRKEREAAGRLPKAENIILTEREVRGDWDASRVLMTTLGGSVRPITSDDLAVFRHNMETAKRAFKGGSGITARQVIDLASAKPLQYTGKDDLERGLASDLDKARREITQAVPASAMNGTIRFITNAGPDSSVTRHYVTVNLNAWHEACAKLASEKLDDKAAVTRVARWLRTQKLAFDCDCERHRYFFRYVATIGGFAAGRQETGYPKIRNPHLRGCACKHVLRVMTELSSSNIVLRFLENHLSKATEYKARTQIRQKEAEKILKGKKRPTVIKTSDQRKAEAAKAREKRALAKASKTPKPDTVHRGKEAAQTKKSEHLAAQLGAQFGLTAEQVLALLASQKKD